MCSSVFAQPSITAKSVLVIDAETNDVLFEKNYQDVRPIASITKLMTAVVVVDAKLPMDEMITITSDDVKETRNRATLTGTSLSVGMTLSRADMLHLALMNSQNRAAYALARTFPGGVVAFVAAMNAKAAELHMHNTSFTEPTGLRNTNVSSAEDLVKLTAEASKHPLIREYSTSVAFQTEAPTKKRKRVMAFGTTNKLVTTPSWNVIAQKTGYIQDAGRCVVMVTTVAARTVIMVLLNTPSNAARAQDAIKLKHWLETNTLLTPPQLAPYDLYAPKRRTYRR